ncbi:MAG: acyl carrier protein [Malacoplasma sp.]|nr:acyl carrier protein [Malacoplasma sp.]MCF0227711.1 acyl carrier protein [Malacoplasma sp.]
MDKNILSKINKIAKQQEVNIVFDDSNKNMTLKELGLDSLSIVSILVGVEDELGVHLPDEVLGDIKTVEQLVEVFEKAKKAK